jgi:uncharacterized protein YecT (DUF1311 family)
MNFKCLLPVLFLVALNFSVAAQDRQFPIDREYQECLAKDTSAGNLYNCSFEAYAAWDRMMDKEFKKLIRNLRSDKDKSAMKQAQTAWMAYRDAEFKSYDNMFNRPGSYWIRMRAQGRIEVVRARALQLAAYNTDIEKK